MSFSEWKKYKLGDLAEFHNTKRVPLNSRDRESKKGIYPYYGASGIVDYLDDYTFDGKFVLISEDGENLRTRKTPIAFKVDGKFRVNNHAHIVKGKEEYLNDWIVYFFQNLDLNPFITGAVQPKLNKENIQLIEIAIPKVEAAKKIVEILSSLDDKIELNRQTNKMLEAIAQTLFKEMCLPLRDEVPDRWTVGKFKDVATQVKENIKPSLFPQKLFNHFSLPAFDSGELPTYDLSETILSNKTIVKKYSVLFSKLNPRIPRIWSIGDINENVSICSTEFIGFVPQHDFQYSFINFFLKQNEITNKLAGHATGTSNSHQRVKPEGILNLDLLIPTAKILKEFDKTVRPFLDLRFQNIQQNQTLSALRDSLLPKLMKGEINI